MDFDEPFEHRLLRESVREVFAAEFPRERIRALDQARQGPPEDLWQRMAGLGWFGLTVPTEHGGGGEDLTSLIVLVEEISREWASLSSVFVLGAMTARLLEQFGTEEQCAAILPGLAAGTVRVAFSLTEPGGGTDVLRGRTRAALADGEWVVQGQKLYTSRVAEADHVVVLARTEPEEQGHAARGWSLILVRRDQPGIEIRKLHLMGFRSAGTSEVFYDGARAPEAAIVGERGRGFYQLIASLNNERITSAAVGVGIAQAALEEAVRYAQERPAFGRPIGAFQAIQHPLADTAIDIAQARLLVQKAAWLESTGRPCSMEAAMANVAAAETAVRAADRGMRVLAGHGMTEDSPMERYLRDSRLQPFSPVSNEMGRNFVGEQLGLPRSY